MNLLTSLIDSRCVGCAAWGDVVCDPCVGTLGSSPHRSTSARGVPIVALGPYRGTLRSLILAAKHRGAHGAIRRFGGAIHQLSAGFNDAVAIPIPSSRTGFLSRGFSPSLEIARATELPVADFLSLSDPRTQRGLDYSARTDRRMFVRDPHPPVGSRAVLVDDVVTTGASIDAATDACWRVGIRVVGIVALAVAPGARHGVAALPKTNFRV